MNSRLLLFSTVVLLAGLELATGFAEYIVRQFRDGVETFLNPNLQPDYLGVVGGSVLILVGLTGIGVWTWARLMTRGMSFTDLCPDCGSETRRVRRQWSHRVASMVSGHRLNRRACKRCSWKGLSLKA